MLSLETIEKKLQEPRVSIKSAMVEYLKSIPVDITSDKELVLYMELAGNSSYVRANPAMRASSAMTFKYKPSLSKLYALKSVQVGDDVDDYI